MIKTKRKQNKTKQNNTKLLTRPGSKAQRNVVVVVVVEVVVVGGGACVKVDEFLVCGWCLERFSFQRC